jgi:hypothetical protein
MLAQATDDAHAQLARLLCLSILHSLHSSSLMIRSVGSSRTI